MKIGFLTPEYPHPLSTPAGGIGSSIRVLAISLVARGMEIHVFLYGQNHNEHLIEDGVQLHFIKQIKYPVAGWYFYRKYLQRYLNRAIHKYRLQLIEAPDWTGITAFMQLRCPLVIRMHGSDSYFCNLENRPQKKKNYWLEKVAVRAADSLVSVSEFTASKSRELFNLKSDITLIPNAVDVHFFSPINRETIPNRLLYFGSIIRKKGVLELASIFNHIVKEKPMVSLWLIGKDVRDIIENRSTLALFKERLSREALERVTYFSETTQEEIREKIAASAVILFPNLVEAMPMSWLEAMAMEKAMVTSDTEWAKEIMIDEKTGIMVNPEAHTVYAAKVLALLNNPEKAKKLGKAARRRVVERYSAAVVAARNEELFSRIINRGSDRKTIFSFSN